MLKLVLFRSRTHTSWLISCLRQRFCVESVIVWLSTLLVWVSSVKTLWKRNHSGAVTSEENTKANCRLITTCVLNTIFFLFPRLIDGIMPRNLPEHVLRQVILLSSQVNSQCEALRWRHNDHAGVSNHQPHGCLLNRLFRRKSKKTSKLRVTGLCAGNSPGTGEFPAQMASYAENVSIWWRHHVARILAVTDASMR